VLSDLGLDAGREAQRFPAQRGDADGEIAVIAGTATSMRRKCNTTRRGAVSGRWRPPTFQTPLVRTILHWIVSYKAIEKQ
jgi:hypothetical protein